jgi:hypothetical protein
MQPPFTDAGNDKGATMAPIILAQICQVLFPGDQNPHIALADLLGVKTKMVKGWLQGKTKTMDRHHEVFAMLETYLMKREQKIHDVRTTLHKWRVSGD